MTGSESRQQKKYDTTAPMVNGEEVHLKLLQHEMHICRYSFQTAIDNLFLVIIYRNNIKLGVSSGTCVLNIMTKEMNSLYEEYSTVSPPPHCQMHPTDIH